MGWWLTCLWHWFTFISSHQSLKCLTSSLKCLWHWLQLDIALMGWFFWTHDQNDSHVVLGWGCTGMVDIGELLKIFGKHGYKVSTKLRYVAYKVVRLYIFYVEIWLFSILNSYTECICIHTNNTHIYIYTLHMYVYIYIHMLQITWIAGCPEFSCALGMSRRWRCWCPLSSRFLTPCQPRSAWVISYQISGVKKP